MLIYTCLVVPLKSYCQLLVIMTVIPFSFSGAIIGHYLFNIDISSMSLFGFIAAAGVVVNDSLVLVDCANRSRQQEASIQQAVIN